MAALGRDHHMVDGARIQPQGLGEELLVNAIARSGRTVDVGGVEQVDARVESGVDGSDAAFLVVSGDLGQRHRAHPNCCDL
jgi:hypothetical protein